MELDLNNEIKNIYRPNDFVIYKNICEKKLPLNEDFFDILKSTPCFKEITPDKLKPGRQWQVKFNEVTEGNFTVHYETIVSITKIVSLFEITHLFHIQNRDPEGLSPILTGRGEAFCMEQLIFEEKIKEYLQKKGYVFSMCYLDVCTAYVFENDQHPPLTVADVLYTDAYTLWKEQ